MEQDTKKNLKAKSTWKRGLFMLLFLIIYSIAEMVIGLVVLIQFGFTLFNGKPNERLLVFGDELSLFLYQVFRYLTFNTEDKPFPFVAWPTKSAQLEAQNQGS